MRRLRSLATAVVALYPLFLVASVLAFRYVGERWWVTGTLLYLPRLPFAAPLPVVLVIVIVAVTGRRWPYWMAIIASAALLLVLVGFVPPGRNTRRSDAPTLRILSYNVDSAMGGADAIVDEIRRYSADVVLLEEIGTAEPLAALLRAQYPTVETVDQFLIATRSLIASTTQPPRILYQGRARSPRSVKYVLETVLGPISLYQVHPISPREALNDVRGQGLRHEFLSGRMFSSAHSAIFRENSGLRALQVQTFAEAAAAERGAVVIAGDTNLPGLSYLLNRYLSAYQDGFVESGWGLGYTFPGGRRRWRGPWMRIDRVFASDSLQFVGFEVGTSLASDHHCVVADIQQRSP